MDTHVLENTSQTWILAPHFANRKISPDRIGQSAAERLPRSRPKELAAMALYYFHLRNHADLLLDPEGRNLDEGNVAAAALSEARAIIAADVASGQVDLSQNIEVENSAGAVVHRVCFDDAVKINHRMPG